MDWQVGQLFALENPADIDARQAIHVSQTAAIAYQSAGGDKLTKLEHCRHRLAQRQRGKPSATSDKEWIGPACECMDTAGAGPLHCLARCGSGELLPPTLPQQSSQQS